MNSIANNPNGKAQISDHYESIEFTLNNGETDYDVDTQQVTFKAIITSPMYCRVSTTQNISIKFNATTNHAISLNANTITEFDRQSFGNIYLSNSSGNASTVRIYVK